MNFALTPEQQRIQDIARRFADDEVAPLAREADERGEFPLHLVRRMGELGFLAGPIQPEYGGAGMDYLSFALVYEELGHAPPPGSQDSVRCSSAGYRGRGQETGQAT